MRGIIISLTLALALVAGACGEGESTTTASPEPTEGPSATDAPSATSETGGDWACTTFVNEADNTMYGPTFSRDGYTFTSLDPAFDPFANATGGVVGLQFGHGGLLVALPAVVPEVIFAAGAFASDVSVESLDPNGNTTDSLTIPATNTFDLYSLAGDVSSIRFTGGDNEGILLDLCADGEFDDLTASACVSFEDLAAGSQFTLNDSFVSGGVTANVAEFFTGGTPFANFVRVDTAGMAGGSGNDMGINNVTLNFRLPPSAEGWSVTFGHYGGEVNLSVNGDNVGTDTGTFADWNGSVFGGAEVQAGSGTGAPGELLLLRGTGIDVLGIGGQELWIDDICPLRS